MGKTGVFQSGVQCKAAQAVCTDINCNHKAIDTTAEHLGPMTQGRPLAARCLQHGGMDSKLTFHTVQRAATLVLLRIKNT